MKAKRASAPAKPLVTNTRSAPRSRRGTARCIDALQRDLRMASHAFAAGWDAQ